MLLSYDVPSLQATPDMCTSDVAIGKASTHLDVGVLEPSGVCVLLSLPMPYGADSLAGESDSAVKRTPCGLRS